MKWLWLLVAVIVGAIAGAGWLLDPGYLLVRYGGVVLETSIAIAVLILVVGIWVSIWVVQLLRRGLRTTTRLADWQHSKAMLAQHEQQKKALLATLGGDWEQSFKALHAEDQILSDSAEAQQRRFIRTALAAHTAHARGDFAERDRVLRASKNVVLELPTLGPLLVAQWYLESGDIKNASKPLHQVLAVSKKNARAWSMLASVHIASKDWEEAEKCWAMLKKLGQPYYTGLRFHAFDFQRQDVFANPIAADSLMLAKLLARRAGALKEYQELAPAQRRNIAFLIAWARELGVSQRGSEGAAVLAAALDEAWDPSVFSQWSELALAAPEDGLQRASGWAKGRTQDAHIQEVLGLLASHSEQWATAKDYFEAALKLLPEKAHAKVRLYRQLGSVWRSLGDDHRALQYFSQAEALATH
ncbi:MAG TPA: hypothetical protein DDZ32_10505 [Gammaproteobacteria bacterium]|nr:hypothetical protein [Gammaproteobacteria bacterium]